jgi:hypothetical protein
MSNLSLGEYALVGFASFWGLIGLGIISTAAYFWLKERGTTPVQQLRPRRRRRG